MTDKLPVSITRAAHLLGVHRTRVHVLAKQGRLAGAYRSGHAWVIPLGKDGKPIILPPGPRKPAASDA